LYLVTRGGRVGLVLACSGLTDHHYMSTAGPDIPPVLRLSLLTSVREWPRTALCGQYWPFRPCMAHAQGVTAAGASTTFAKRSCVVQKWSMVRQCTTAAACSHPDTTITPHHCRRYLNTTASPPIYKFGYGLSFSTFNYSKLSVHFGGPLVGANVSVTVTNTGGVPAAEVAQLYVVVPRRSDVPVPLMALQVRHAAGLNPPMIQQHTHTHTHTHADANSPS
jgi:hypothetical protein